MVQALGWPLGSKLTPVGSPSNGSKASTPRRRVPALPSRPTTVNEKSRLRDQRSRGGGEEDDGPRHVHGVADPPEGNPLEDVGAEGVVRQALRRSRGTDDVGATGVDRDVVRAPLHGQDLVACEIPALLAHRRDDPLREQEGHRNLACYFVRAPASRQSLVYLDGQKSRAPAPSAADSTPYRLSIY